MTDTTDDGSTAGGTDSETACEYARSCPEDGGAHLRSSGWVTAGDRFRADKRAEYDRRDFAKVLATFGGIAAVGSLAAPLAGLSRVFERRYEGPIYTEGTALIDAEGERIEENRLEMGDVMTAFPATHPGLEQAPTLLVRYPESEYSGETRLPFTVSGYAAYSKVCTHAGCMVSDREEAILVCPCHFGKFDSQQGAIVVGGPPPRPLPQLPLTLSSDGYLMATGQFEGPVGVEEG